MISLIKKVMKFFCYQKNNLTILTMDSYKRSDETLLPNKKYFYGSLNMEGIADIDKRDEKRVYKENFSNTNIGDYHDLYVQSDILLL